MIHGDCLDVMPTLEAGSIDAIITDLPYGTTACKWDEVIPFAPMWEQVKRILKPRGAFVTTASQPFTSALVMSNVEWFKYCLVWVKSRATGHVHAKNKPMKKHEDVVVFSNGTTVHKAQSTKRMTYNPQGLIKLDNPILRKKGGAANTVMQERDSHKDTLQRYTNYPNTILDFASASNTVAPTQKPVALYEYLIRTYTNEGDTVLDIACGSGTTGVACVRVGGRDFIGIDKGKEWVNVSRERIKAELSKPWQEALPHVYDGG
jgi:site-specific DNA-methyltransferase (adenine-specific)